MTDTLQSPVIEARDLNVALQIGRLSVAGMMARLGFFVIAAILASGAQAQDCPVTADAELWVEAACDFSDDKMDIAANFENLKPLANFIPVEDSKMWAAMKAAPAFPIMADGDKGPMLRAPINMLTIAKRGGIVADKDFSDEEMTADADLIHSANEDGTPSFKMLVSYINLLLVNRGGRLFLVYGPGGSMFTLAVSETDFCKWHDVRLAEYAMLGSLEKLNETGTIGEVEWADRPHECGEEAE